MNSLNQYIICTIKAALTDYKLELSDVEVDWIELFSMAEEHKITCIVGLGLAEVIDKIPTNIKGKFEKEINKNILLDAKQEYAAMTITAGFEKKSLKYMLMKGYNLKKLYPESYMRYMCDIDILIDNENYEQYEMVMKELAYEKKVESDHEHIFVKPPMINVELHKRIVPSYYADLYAYYGDGWARAEKKDEGFGYEYSIENQYIFLIVHLAKHYQGSGIGLSHFVDIFIMNKNVDYNKQYVNEELQKLGLKKFHENVLKLIDFWFGDGDADDVIIDMSEFVFSCGAYGNFQNRIATETMKGIEKYGSEKSAKRVKRLEVIFPSCKRLSENFKILNKYPWLYPFCLIYRNVRAISFRRNKIKKYMDGINANNETYMNRLAVHLSEIGLKNNEHGNKNLTILHK